MPRAEFPRAHELPSVVGGDAQVTVERKAEADAEDLPEDLVFHVNYLGGDMPTFTLNFSRPGNQVVGQYYNFVRLGRDGFTRPVSTGDPLLDLFG